MIIDFVAWRLSQADDSLKVCDWCLLSAAFAIPFDAATVVTFPDQINATKEK